MYIKRMQLSHVGCGCPSHTYPIAIGYDGHSHEKVEERFASELMEFWNGKMLSFYHGGIQNMYWYT